MVKGLNVTEDTGSTRREQEVGDCQDKYEC